MLITIHKKINANYWKQWFLLILFLVIKISTKEQTVAFSAPDTVCVNTPVKIVNQSLGGTSFYWNFNVADINTVPEATNLGNVGGTLQIPVFTDVVSDNGKYYVFVTNNYPSKLVRLNFGNSLLNIPVVDDLGNFGGIIPGNTEGIQVVNNEGKWYAIIVGGSTLSGTLPSIIKIDFGINLDNPSPVATNLGNIGNLDYPVDLHVFNENNNWYGFTLNANNNTFTRFNFGTGFEQPPTAVNLGNIGNLNYPTGIYAIKDNQNWHVFITNEGENNSNPSITRLDFGNSLLNTPAAVNLGNPESSLHRPRDIYIMKFCGEITGFIVNGEAGSDDIVQLDFQNNLVNIPKATSLGNLGNLDFPHSISKLFRIGPDLYSFITNARNNTITRIRFAGSNNASMPNSSLKDPPVISYSQPGTYNINLMIDEGLSTQASFCKSVVVLPPPKKTPTIDTAFCAGDSVLLKSNFINGINLWNIGSNNNSIAVKIPGIYWLDVNAYGCSVRDSMVVSKKQTPIVEIGNDTAICNGDSLRLDAKNIGLQFLWQNGSTRQTLIAKTAGLYSVRVTGKNGCNNEDSIRITLNPLPVFQLTNDTTICRNEKIQLRVSGNVNITAYKWLPNPSLVGLTIPTPVASPLIDTKYFIFVTDTKGCRNEDSVLVKVDPLPEIKTIGDSSICTGTSLLLQTSGVAAYTYKWVPVNYLSDPFIQNPVASPLSPIRYTVTAKDVFGCTSETSVSLNVKNLPVVNTYGDTIICYATPVQLLATSSGNSNFEWKPGSNLNNPMISNPVASPLETTTYHVSVTGNNCTSNDSVVIRVFPNPVFTIHPEISNICQGDSVILSVSGGDQYQWSSTTSISNPTPSSAIVFPITDTHYQVFITDSKCKVSGTVNAQVNILPQTQLSIAKSNDINCILGEATLSASGGVNYQWFPQESLSSPTLSSTTAAPSLTTVYFVKATNINGCISEDSIELKVEKSPIGNSYLMPTAFTPNSDGLNDCFGVIKWGYITNLEFSIFNRWGERVFFTKTPSSCWDGLYKGKPQPLGTYVYLIKAKGICGNINRKGTVELIR